MADQITAERRAERAARVVTKWHKLPDGTLQRLKGTPA
jgi:hypothetical protein